MFGLASRSARLSGRRRRLGTRSAPRRTVAQADAADQRKLERGAEHVEPEVEAEHVQLDALGGPDAGPEYPVKRDLAPRAGLGAAVRAFRQPVLADGVGRQLDGELRDAAHDIGDEGVAVGAGPGAVKR